MLDDRLPESARKAALRTARRATGTLLLIATVTGCSAGSSPAPDRPKSAPPASTPESRPEHIRGESASLTPSLPEGKPLAEVSSTSGNRTIPLGRIGAGPLSVLVNCRGKGTLKVTVQPVAMSFPHTCVTGRVSSTYNALRLKEARETGSITVTAPATVRWALAAGR